LAFRIFVMLSCLIIVPLAAIFGSAFPDIVKSVLVDRIVAWSSGKSFDPNKPSTEPSGFSAVTASAAANSGQAGSNNWEAPRWGTQNATAGAWQPGAAGPQGGGVVPAVATDAARGTPPGHPLERPNVDTPYRNPPAENGVAIRQQFTYPANPPVAPPGEPAGAAAGRPAPRPLEPSDRFTAMERKLREYGATYYLLETWGNDGDLYRFHCRMAISNNPNYTRQFEATDRDSLKAMAQVLERVEAWRAGRLQ
jgi:hypothetical protein